MTARATQTRRRTRIQEENENKILAAALDVFSDKGFRGASLDDIAKAAGMSKPNILYYFRGKEEIHLSLLARLLEDWLAPLTTLNPEGDPIEEVGEFVRLKLKMARDFPRESRLFANEILRGAPHISDHLHGLLKAKVDEQCKVLQAWMDAGKIAKVSPHHLIFTVWATTQHYADFDTQIGAVLGKQDETRFEDAEATLLTLILGGLRV